MICAFTGHRPEKLPWGGRETDQRCLALKVQLSRAIQDAAAAGAESFACGMARGCDLYFAEAVLALGYPLTAWLPCPEQASRWNASDRRRYEALLSQCCRVYTVSDRYFDGCLARRNRAMVDSADYLISVWDGEASGTGATVAYAKARGRTVIGLWR